jgi:hypothetical protein
MCPEHNDFWGAVDLVDLLRMGRLPESWIAPPATRELRERVSTGPSWSPCAAVRRKPAARTLVPVSPSWCK